jgi:hypothetical protein
LFFSKKFPKVYLVLKTVFMLNLSPFLLNFSEIPLMYGMDITHTDLFIHQSWGRRAARARGNDRNR